MTGALRQLIDELYPIGSRKRARLRNLGLLVLRATLAVSFILFCVTAMFVRGVLEGVEGPSVFGAVLFTSLFATIAAAVYFVAGTAFQVGLRGKPVQRTVAADLLLLPVTLLGLFVFLITMS